ncbi:MAG: CPBP family intramembrane metalloprotease [Anaerolineae bacterium]|nr:CPBP family intramembrane metalloprotease [Anaerolineae bacterium]
MVTTTRVSTTTEAPSTTPLWRGKDVLIMSLAMVAGMGVAIAGLAVPLGLTGSMPGAQTVPAWFTLGVLAAQAAVILAMVWLLGLKRRHYRWADIGLVPATPGWIAAAVAIFVVLRLVTVALSALLAQLGLQSMQPQVLAPGLTTLPGAIGMLFLAGLAVPVAEEIFFRGVVYRWLRDRWGVAIGAIASGVVFGLVHFEPATIVPAIVLGIALALVYERSKSLWPPILIHVLNNALAVGLLYVLIALGVPIPGVN